MLIQIITITIFGSLGYFIASSIKSSISNRINIILVILLIIAANTHGFGYSGIGELRLYHSDILQGIIGGFLIGRMSIKGPLMV